MPGELAREITLALIRDGFVRGAAFNVVSLMIQERLDADAAKQKTPDELPRPAIQV